LPGIDSQYGLVAVIGMMIASTGVLLWVLRKFNWL